MKVTPDNITSLPPNGIFVFGSNLKGYHGAGAAADAVERFGAVMGKGEGLQGNSYALPTKDEKFKPLPLSDIQMRVLRLFGQAVEYCELEFFITPIGCGYAGYTPEQIAPMFRDFLTLKNVTLPESFLKVLNDGK